MTWYQNTSQRLLPKNFSPSGQIDLEDVLDHVFQFAGKMRRKFILASDDLLVQPHGVHRVERRQTGVEFVDEDAESPPVYWLAVPFAEDYFWCQVFGSAAQRPRSSSDNLQHPVKSNTCIENFGGNIRIRTLLEGCVLYWILFILNVSKQDVERSIVILNYAAVSVFWVRIFVSFQDVILMKNTR